MRQLAVLTTLTAGLMAHSSYAAAHVGSAATDYVWVDSPDDASPRGVAQGRQAVVDAGLFLGGRAEVWTPDLQAIVALPTSSTVAVSLTPEAPSGDVPLPTGRHPSGNAHTVELVGQFDGATVVLRPPHMVTDIARWDGTRWVLTLVTPDADGRVAVPWAGAGPYVGAASRLDGHRSGVAALVHDRGSVWLLAVGLFGAVAGVVRRGRRQPPPNALATRRRLHCRTTSVTWTTLATSQ